MSYRLLADDEPAPVTVEREDSPSEFFLVCEHAGKRIPRRLQELGLPAPERERHIAYDIGAGGMSRVMARCLDATLVTQAYSRLVIDCNRSPGVPSAMPQVSESTTVPGNLNIPVDQREARIAEIFTPFHDTVRGLLDRRADASREAVLVTLHSFTPVFKGVSRPWQVGVLYNRDARLGHALLAELADEPDLCVGDNEPYRVDDMSDYTIPVHGEQRGIVHVEIEVRQDLLADEAGQRHWGERLAGWIPRAYRRMNAALAGQLS